MTPTVNTFVNTLAGKYDTKMVNALCKQISSPRRFVDRSEMENVWPTGILYLYAVSNRLTMEIRMFGQTVVGSLRALSERIILPPFVLERVVHNPLTYEEFKEIMDTCIEILENGFIV